VSRAQILELVAAAVAHTKYMIGRRRPVPAAQPAAAAVALDDLRHDPAPASGAHPAQLVGLAPAGAGR
jgi:hypothetical protein